MLARRRRVREKERNRVLVLFKASNLTVAWVSYVGREIRVSTIARLHVEV